MKRKSPISGSWYKGTEHTLREQIKSLFLDKEFGAGRLPEEKGDNQQIGVVSPHAGLMYSGYTASRSYLALKERMPNPSSVIIIGPNHTGLGSPISTSQQIWETPFGEILIDEELLEPLIKSEIVVVDEYAHQREHSVEIQLPFIQYIYPGLKHFIPICMGAQSKFKKLAHEIFKTIEGRDDIALVASSDLSHEHDYSVLEANDMRMLQLIEEGDADKAEIYRSQVNMTMCGYGPVFTLLELRKLRGTQGRVKNLGYSNSSQVMNDFSPQSYRVGYSSFIIPL